MNKYLLKIELLSDACISSGVAANSSIDCDVYTNEYGFPYIPAKRLKGLLREACLDYNNLIDDKADYLDELFGYEFDGEGSLVVSDAMLDEFKAEEESIVNDIVKNNIKPSIIKSFYVSQRTQTKIDKETGQAQNGSLRTINVVNKGLVFVSSISLDSKYATYFKSLVKLIKHMGLNRNRGFGLVRCSLEDDKAVTKSLALTTDCECLELHITNTSALLLASDVKDKTLPYINGSTIYGYFANNYAKKKGLINKEPDEEFTELFLNNNLKFTNAYISDNEFNEYIPCPAFIRKQKNKDENNRTVYISLLNKERADNDAKQVSLTGKYIKLSDLTNPNGLPVETYNGKEYYAFKIIEPEYEFAYHHSRDESGLVKSFYSYLSLAPNQNFVSKIYGPKKLLEKLIKCCNEKEILLGKSKNSQYGKCKLQLLPLKKKDNNNLDGDLLVFKSQAVIKDNMNKSLLDIESICNTLNITNKELYSLKYEAVGGFNQLWRLPRPSVMAVAFESYIIGNIKLESNFIGEDNFSGKGNVIVLNKDNLLKKYNVTTAAKTKKQEIKASNWFSKGDYYTAKHNDDVMQKAYDFAFNQYNGCINLNSTQIERVLKMIQELKSFEAFKINVESIARESTKNTILDCIKKADGIYSSGDYKLFYNTLFTVFKYNKRLGGDEDEK